MIAASRSHSCFVFPKPFLVIRILFQFVGVCGNFCGLRVARKEELRNL